MASGITSKGKKTKRGEKMMKPLVILLTTAGLVACGGGEHADIKKWMDDETKNMKGRNQLRLMRSRLTKPRRSAGEPWMARRKRVWRGRSSAP